MCHKPWQPRPTRLPPQALQVAPRSTHHTAHSTQHGRAVSWEDLACQPCTQPPCVTCGLRLRHVYRVAAMDPGESTAGTSASAVGAHGLQCMGTDAKVATCATAARPKRQACMSALRPHVQMDGWDRCWRTRLKSWGGGCKTAHSPLQSPLPAPPQSPTATSACVSLPSRVGTGSSRVCTIVNISLSSSRVCTGF